MHGCASTSARRQVSARPTRCFRRPTRYGPAASTSSSDLWRPTTGATPRPSSRISRSCPGARWSTAARRMEEMDVEAIIERAPKVCVVDELAHTNVPGSRHAKRYEDVLDLLEAGIHVMTAVNIQHLETLNDAVAKATGVRVRETVPDTFLDRADEVINVDVTVEELRNRLRAGKIYRPEKVEQALTNFFRKGNLSTLRELALARGGRRSWREGRELSCARGSGTGADSRAGHGVHELECARAAGHPDRRAESPAGWAPNGTPSTCRRRASSRAASGRGTPRRCRRTSGLRRASGRRWSGSRRTVRPTVWSPSRSAKGSRTSSSARAPGRAWSSCGANRRSTNSSAPFRMRPCRSFR